MRKKLIGFLAVFACFLMLTGCGSSAGSEEAQEIPEQPSTYEARAVSFGMDKLPKEQREMILNMVCAMFPNTFEKGEDK